MARLYNSDAGSCLVGMWYARLPAYGNTKVKYAPVPKPREVALNSRYGLGTCVLDATYPRQRVPLHFGLSYCCYGPGLCQAAQAPSQVPPCH